jgi:trk system potassium uptake protein TrkA
MFVIIVGGGKVGSHLAHLLLKEGHQIKVIDDRPEVLENIKDELPGEVIAVGDGSSPAVLEAAGVRRAKVLAAVTGEDEANLVITTLARFEFNVPRVIARVNNPKNEWMFTKEMGVDVALNQAGILGKLIAEEMSLGDMMTMLKLRRGKYSLVEEKIYPGAKAIGVALKDLPLPKNCTISGILRGSEMILPRGVTTLEAGDEVLALVDDDAAAELAKLLGRPTESK